MSKQGIPQKCAAGTGIVCSYVMEASPELAMQKVDEGKPQVSAMLRCCCWQTVNISPGNSVHEQDTAKTRCHDQFAGKETVMPTTPQD